MPDTGRRLSSRTVAGTVGGFVAPGFEAVREVFIDNLDSGLEGGVSFAVTCRGAPVVDLWGGHVDKKRSTLLHEHSLFNLFSTTKGLAATCIAVLVDRGKLSYESPVADYWPEFARAGKGGVTVGQLMSHQAGLCGAREPVTIEDFYDHERLAGWLAAQTPFFTPGSAWGYHSLTLGTLADELVRRVDGRTIGEFFAAEVAGPLELDAFLGLPEKEDWRQAEMIPPVGATQVDCSPPNLAAYRAMLENPTLDPEWPNTRRWRAVGLSSGGGSANARSMAQLYSILTDTTSRQRGPLLSAETMAAATRERIAGINQVSGLYGRFGAGFLLNSDGIMGPNAQAFGHGGWGGSIAFGDPAHRLGIAYVMNQMRIAPMDQPDTRAPRLIGATYESLHRLPASLATQ